MFKERIGDMYQKEKKKLINQILINDENVILHINVDGDTDIKGEWCANKM